MPPFSELVAWVSVGLVVVLGVSGLPAMLLGVLLGSCCGTPRGAGRVGGALLRAGIVASGARMPLTAVLAAGIDGFAGSAVVIVAVALVALVCWRPLRVDGSTATLVAAGTAICGGSAIAAVGPAIGARSSAVATALAVVFALNGVALVVFPWLGTDLSEQAYARFCALGIHDTSSVVGAAAVRGDGVLTQAVALKLARSLWIVPVALLASLALRRRGVGEPVPRPWFIAGFVLVSALVTWVPDLEGAGAVAAGLGARAMNGALICVGFALTPTALRRMGPRPLLLGLVLWAVVMPLAYWL